MDYKINISKKLLLRLAMFLAVIGIAIILDVYLENNPAELEKIQAESESKTADQGKIYLISQNGSTNVKTSIQKSVDRKLQLEKHDKFIRKYHNLRNYQVLKAEAVTKTTPLILSYHYLVFQDYFFTQPDEDSL
ncbi:MAG: hypothetical protein R3182_15525, partial [Draconibacterium sp.]|nr:hypothetical protein [Draconibacterium sp.]